jgi:hypothetical protein
MIGELAFDNMPWSILSRSRRLTFKARATWRSRDLASIAARHLLASGRPCADKLRRARQLLATVGNYWTARLVVPNDDIVLFDEGLAQRIITAFIDGNGRPDLSAVKRYARAMPLPDMLVYVKADPEIAIERAHSRTGLSRRFEALSRSELRYAFVNAAQALEALVSELCSTTNPRVKVVLIDANNLDSATIQFDSEVVLFLTRLARETRTKTARGDLASHASSRFAGSTFWG